ncbi:hypothetical protein F4677DRAFT_418715 [Hypoxylon crocopeplum]|nr:hypothetical protein F4677DRAFT_418715 [Hypoxylon crocopeplum]
MADPLGAAGSIVGIAAFGLKFATTLQTYIEAVADAQESLRDIVFDVSATASALEQIHDFVKADLNGKAIATDPGLQQVLRLASQCKQVYTAVINLIAKAAGLQKNGNGDASLDALDLDILKATSLIQKLKWPFREPRIKKHRDELRWLKISLLFQLRLMELAKTKMTSPARSQSAWEREVALQATLEKLLRRKETYTKKLAIERKRGKGKRVRKKKVLTRTSSSTGTIEEARSRSPSLRRRTPIARPTGPFIHSPREKLPPLRKGNHIGSLKNSSSSDEGASEDLATWPNKPRPKPPKIKSKLPGGSTLDLKTSSVASNTAARSSNTQPVKDIGPRDNNISSLLQPSPTQDSKQKSLGNESNTPSQTLVNPQGSAINAVDGQSITHSNPGNADNKKGVSHGLAEARVEGTHTLKLSRGTLNAIPWISNLFRKRERFEGDWESQELEAYLIEEDPSTLRKLPFGHRKLTDMLGRLTKSRKGDVWAQYASLTPAQRESVDRATLEANRSNPRPRTCVAISSQTTPTNTHIVVFYFLGLPAQPVHLKAEGRYFQFAYELCRTWEEMEELIKRAVGDKVYVQNNRYELKGPDDRVLLPTSWRNTVQPGLVVFLAPKLHRPTLKAPGPIALPADMAFRPGTWADTVSPSVPPIKMKGKKKQSTESAVPLEAVETPPDSDVSSSYLSGPSEPGRPWYGAARGTRRAGVSTRSARRSVPPPADEDIIVIEERGRRQRSSRPRYRTRDSSIGSERSELESEADFGGTEDEDEEGVDIIDFEEEQENIRLGLGGLLEKWTNAFDAHSDEGQ